MIMISHNTTDYYEQYHNELEFSAKKLLFTQPLHDSKIALGPVRPGTTRKTSAVPTLVSFSNSILYIRGNWFPGNSGQKTCPE